ncbi:MAG TPA: DNA recombination protein RmuC, partial [Armatimonadota bacterium]|nr:DNA recombination protein RmuC [Armatimonadota bacterium]
MNLLNLALALALGIVIGAFIGWLVARARAARLAAQLDAERRGAAEKLAVIQQAEAGLRDAFAALSAEALQRNGESFLQLAQTKLGEFQRDASAGLEAREKAFTELVKPIKQSLEQVDSRIQQVEKERTGAFATLLEQVRAM